MHSIESINNHNLLNDLVFRGNYLFPTHYNDVNNTNEYNNNTIPIAIVNTMNEIHVMLIRKIIWLGKLWLLCHSTCSPIANKCLLEASHTVSLDYTSELALHAIRSSYEPMYMMHQATMESVDENT